MDCRNDSTSSAVNHIFECRNVSLVRNLSSSNWDYFLNGPQLSAQFLKNVSMVVRSGEIHGVIGNAGSGKTILLNLIAGKNSGEVSGSIMLDGQVIDGKFFKATCAFTTFDEFLIPCITVKSYMNFYANFMTRGKDVKDKEEMILSLLHEFDLLSYVREKVGSLPESARRRMILCMVLLKDPLLVLLDEPLRNLDTLSSFQLIYSLGTIMKRRRRMAIIAMRCPRTDIYQLLSKITILFYGNPIYSGTTKHMPTYFKQIGFPCPTTENPAVYYLSLATIDRETAERYHETQEQALKLADLYSELGDNFQRTSSFIDCSPSLHKRNGFCSANTLCKIDFLIRRVFVLITRKSSLIRRFALVPLCFLLVSLFGMQIMNYIWFLPRSAAALFFTYNILFSFSAIFISAEIYHFLCEQMLSEFDREIYNPLFAVISFLIPSFIFDFFTVFISNCIIIWLCNDIISTENFWKLFVLFMCCYESCQMQTVLLMSVLRNPFHAINYSSIISIISISIAGAFLMAPRTFISLDDWRYIASYPSIYRYTLSYLNTGFISSMNSLNCSRNERSEIDISELEDFCRWPNGSIFINEIYPSQTNYLNQSVNFWAPLIIVSSLFFILIIFYFLPFKNFDISLDKKQCE